MLIVFTNTKGGVGKSTLASHLAFWLAERGFKVGLLDADLQRSSSQWVSEGDPRIEVRVASSPEEVAENAQGLRLTNDFVVGDGPAGLDDISRTLLILADLAIFPITPSILDLRAVSQATSVLKFAQTINGGRPEGRLVLNRFRKRDAISRELKTAAKQLGLTVAENVIRDLQVYRDAAQQGTSVFQMKKRPAEAAEEVDKLFSELVPQAIDLPKEKIANE